MALNFDGLGSVARQLADLYLGNPHQAAIHLKQSPILIAIEEHEVPFVPLKRVLRGLGAPEANRNEAMLARNARAQESARYAWRLKQLGLQELADGDEGFDPQWELLTGYLWDRHQVRPSKGTPSSKAVRRFWVKAKSCVEWTQHYSIEYGAAEHDAQGPLFEGTERQATRVERERSALARDACIRHYMTADGRIECVVCRADFQKLYGEMGEGFIHVHHINPLAEAKGAREVSPEHDLVPVCPNCHAMIHRGGGTRTIKEVREAYRGNGSA